MFFYRTQIPKLFQNWTKKERRRLNEHSEVRWLFEKSPSKDEIYFQQWIHDQKTYGAKKSLKGSDLESKSWPKASFFAFLSRMMQWCEQSCLTTASTWIKKGLRSQDHCIASCLAEKSSEHYGLCGSKFYSNVPSEFASSAANGQLNLDLYSSDNPVLYSKSKALFSFIDSVTYLLSCSSFWRGFSPLTFFLLKRSTLKKPKLSKVDQLF